MSQHNKQTLDEIWRDFLTLAAVLGVIMLGAVSRWW